MSISTRGKRQSRELARIIKVKKILDEIDKGLKYIERRLKHYSRIVKGLKKIVEKLLKESKDTEIEHEVKELETQLESIMQRLSEWLSSYEELVQRRQEVQVRDISKALDLRDRVKMLQRDVEGGLKELEADITEIIDVIIKEVERLSELYKQPGGERVLEELKAEIAKIKEEVGRLSELYRQPGGGAGRECTVRVLVLDEKSGKGVEEIEVSIGGRVCKTNSEGVAEEKVGCNEKVKVKIEDHGKPCIVKRWEVNGKVIKREDNGENNELAIDVTEDIELKAYVEASNS